VFSAKIPIKTDSGNAPFRLLISKKVTGNYYLKPKKIRAKSLPALHETEHNHRRETLREKSI
jgi:hypothetical protein